MSPTEYGFCNAKSWPCNPHCEDCANRIMFIVWLETEICTLFQTHKPKILPVRRLMSKLHVLLSLPAIYLSQSISNLFVSARIKSKRNIYTSPWQGTRVQVERPWKRTQKDIIKPHWRQDRAVDTPGRGRRRERARSIPWAASQSGTTNHQYQIIFHNEDDATQDDVHKNRSSEAGSGGTRVWPCMVVRKLTCGFFSRLGARSMAGCQHCMAIPPSITGQHTVLLFSKVTPNYCENCNVPEPTCWCKIAREAT